jgi:glycosyltransferase involved in cell wall biosynthesis
MKESTAIFFPLYGTRAFGRESENIECMKALSACGYQIHAWGSYREKGGGQVGDKLLSLGYLKGLLPFGSHFSLEYFRTINGYWHRQVTRIVRCSLTLWKAEKQLRPKFIFLGGTMEYLYLFPYLTVSRSKVIFRPGDSPPLDSWFHRNVYRSLLHRADYIVPVSDFVLNQCVDLYPSTRSKAFVIHNCVPNDLENLSTSTDAMEQERADVLRILYVGQITKQKGIEMLVETLQMLPKSSFECVIVGGSSHTIELETLLKATTEINGLNVRWMGYQPDVAPFFGDTDIHIAPSIYEEPFGLVVIEAKKYAVPSIVFPSGGMKSLISHLENGLIVAEKSQIALKQALEQVLALKISGKLVGFSKNARLDYEMNYTFLKFQSKWAFLMDSLENHGNCPLG